MESQDWVDLDEAEKWIDRYPNAKCLTPGEAAARVLRSAEEMGIGPRRLADDPIYRDTYVRAQPLPQRDSPEPPVFRDTYIRAQPLPQCDTPEPSAFRNTYIRAQPLYHHAGQDLECSANQTGESSTPAGELQQMQFRMHALEEALRMSERDRKDAERAAATAHAALRKEKETRYELETWLDQRIERREMEQQHVMDEYVEQLGEQHEELTDQLERAVKAYKEERKERLSLREQNVELMLAGRVEHRKYCSAREHYENALSQLTIARAGIELLQRELSTSEWTNDLFKHKLCSVMDEMADHQGGFSFTQIQQGVREAVQEARKLPPNENKKALREMRMRWHPDKNKMLKEFATEVTKLINDELAAIDACEKHAADQDSPPHHSMTRASSMSDLHEIVLSSVHKGHKQICSKLDTTINSSVSDNVEKTMIGNIA